MASRQDQLHSYQFAVQRVVAALTVRESDPAQPPFRRLAGAVLVGVLLAAVGVGGAAAYGVLRPGGASGNWRDERVIVVEKESGALFVYRKPLLHPVLNHASALLLINTPDARTVQARRADLSKAPRGAALGIPGAPASLPAKGALSAEPWTVCTGPQGSVLFIGARPDGGVKLGDRGLLVDGPGRRQYLIWRNRKHLVRPPDAVRAGTSVAQAFLHAVPTGADLAAPAVAGRGAAVGGGRVGELFGVRTGDRVDAYVLTAEGLASLTPLQAALLLAAPEQGGAGPRWLGAAEFAALSGGREVRAFGPGLPVDPPEVLAGGPLTACMADEITTGATDLSRGFGTVTASTSGTVLVDRVVVPPGGGALVRTDTGVLSLVTDLGRRHAVPDAAVLPALGYGGVEPRAVPAELLGLLPAGPALDAAQAGKAQ